MDTKARVEGRGLGRDRPEGEICSKLESALLLRRLPGTTSQSHETSELCHVAFSGGKRNGQMVPGWLPSGDMEVSVTQPPHRRPRF